MSRFLSTFACVALLAAGCGSSPSNPAVSFPVTMTLQAGQSATAGGLFVKFVEVSDDFRCPINAACFTAGDAVLVFDLSTDGRFANQPLRVYDPKLRLASFEGYSIEVKDLAPARDTNRVMSKDEYKVTLVVSR